MKVMADAIVAYERFHDWQHNGLAITRSSLNEGAMVCAPGTGWGHSLEQNVAVVAILAITAPMFGAFLRRSRDAAA